MNDETNLPENDRDLRLARRIGDLLEKGTLEGARLDDRTPHELDDEHEVKHEAFIRTLMAWRGRAVAAAEKPSEEASNRLWQRIEEETRDRPSRPDRRPIEPAMRRTPRWTWVSLAAAVLVGGIIALLVLRGPSEMLVASAGADTVRYTAGDGSIVTLRPYSGLYLLDESGENVRYRLEGEALFAVSERGEGTFAVEAGEALVEVLGTRFNVSTWGGATSVYLEEGRIRLSHRSTGEDVVLTPGQASHVTHSGELKAAAAEPPDEHLDWLRGELQFQQRSVRLVAAEMEQHFGIDLELPAPILDVTLTGRILLDEPMQSLTDLAEVIGGRFVEIGPNTYLFISE